jgi:hypothetical protein
LIIVGEAAALGLAVEIPILIRSLAQSFPETTTGPALPYHQSMQAALDNGLPEDDPCALVPDYACDWWNDDAEPDAAQIMSATNLDMLLERHAKHRRISDLPIGWPVSSSHRVPTCSRCLPYYQLVGEAMNELDSVRQSADAMHVAAEATFDADTRRAQGFFLLHDAVVQKEMRDIGTETVSTPGPQHKGPTKLDGVNVHRKSQRAHATAKAELERLQRLPPSSHKWTWGPQLTEAEAIALLTPPGEPIPPHSGYDVSLPSGGWMRFPESLAPSMPNNESTGDSPVLGGVEIPPLSQADVAIDRLAYRQTDKEVRRYDDGSDIYVPDAELVAGRGDTSMPREQGGGVMETEGVAREADNQQGIGESPSGFGVTDLALVWGGDAEDNAGMGSDAVRDPVMPAANGESDDESDEGFISAWAQVGHEADNEMAGDDRMDVIPAADAQNKTDLASIWGHVPQASDEQATANAGSGLRTGNESCKALGHSDHSSGNLAARGSLGDGDGAGGLIQLTDAEDGEGHPGDSVEDLAMKWGNLADDTTNASEGNTAEGDLAEIWFGAGAELEDADPESLTEPGPIHPIDAEDGEGHSDDSVEDLAMKWGNLADDKTKASEGNTAEGDLAEIWFGAGAELEDADPESLTGPGPIDPIDAEDGEGHSDDSVEDLAMKWGNLGDDQTTASEGNTAEGDLAEIWCGAGAELNDADPFNLLEAGAAGSSDADAGIHANPHEQPLSDPTIGVTSLTPSRLTLPAPAAYTGLDFDFLDPRWLDPSPLQSPNDSDEDQDSDDGSSSGDSGYEEESDDEEEGDDEEDAEAV